MPASRKIIKQRLKSIKNTRKITKAMELVAASKMRKAVANALKARPFSEKLKLVIKESLAKAPDNVTHRLMATNPKSAKVLVLLFSADRGLAGGLNVNLARTARDFVYNEQSLGKEVEVVGIGRKGCDSLARLGVKVIARFPALSNNPALADLLPAVKICLDAFLSGEYCRVDIITTKFVSGITQKPIIETLLPIVSTEDAYSPDLVGDIIFEPSVERVLDEVLPQLTETISWQLLLESVASEHAARMIAMKNASDAARDMIDDLSFTYNQARQGAITQEIAEISGGKAALE